MDRTKADAIIAEMHARAESLDQHIRECYPDSSDAPTALIARRTAEWNHVAGAVAFYQHMCEIEDATPETHEPTPDDLDAMRTWSWPAYRAQRAEFGHIVNGERVYS